MTVSQAKVAVLLPWYNEDLTVADVVVAFEQSLRGAEICVYDNNSTDDTREAALAARRQVRADRFPARCYRQVFRNFLDYLLRRATKSGGSS
jgi:glycosyltransferase involved in cell wall biosynthesis